MNGTLPAIDAANVRASAPRDRVWVNVSGRGAEPTRFQARLLGLVALAVIQAGKALNCQSHQIKDLKKVWTRRCSNAPLSCPRPWFRKSQQRLASASELRLTCPGKSPVMAP